MHAIAHWLKSGDWAPTFEGVATFLTAVVALVAAVIAYRAVKRQIAAEKQAREEEQIQRRQALASALLAEVDSFYVDHLEGGRALFDSWERMKGSASAREVLVVIAARPFTVYEACAERIGILDHLAARAVVACYGTLSAYAEMLERYESYVKRTWSDPEHQLVRTMFQNDIRGLHTQAIQIAVSTSRLLAQVAGVDFEKLMVAKETHRGESDNLVKSL